MVGSGVFIRLSLWYKHEKTPPQRGVKLAYMSQMVTVTRDWFLPGLLVGIS